MSTRYVTLWSPRWPTKIDLQVLKKVAAHSGGLDIWVLSIKIQKSNIGWPPQPPTKRVPNFQTDISWFYNQSFLTLNPFLLNIKIKFILVIKLINSRIWLTLKNSVVIFLASDTYAASLTSAASEISMASTTSKTLFSSKKFLILMISSHLVPKWPILVPFCGLDH